MSPALSCGLQGGELWNRIPFYALMPKAQESPVLDEHLILVPKSLCPTNSSTMWRALSAGSGGYDEALSGLQSGFVAFLTTCDAHICPPCEHQVVEVHRSEASGPGPHASDILCVSSTGLET